MLEGFYADEWMLVKSLLINKAVQDIGMGRYNWQLFILCGFGWFADKYVLPVSRLRSTKSQLANRFPVSGCK